MTEGRITVGKVETDNDGAQNLLTTRFDSYITYRINAAKIYSLIDRGIESHSELDSHADSPVVGEDCVILEYTGKTVSVQGFTSELGKPLRVQVVNAAVAYDDEFTGQTHIMLIYNALYMPRMKCNLLPPFMLRLAGVEVDECAKFLAKSPKIENHSIYFPDVDLRVHLNLEGTVSYFPTRKPTQDEISEQSGAYLRLTPNIPEWDPHSVVYREQEEAMLDYKGDLKDRKEPTMLIDAVTTIDDLADAACDQSHLIASICELENVSSVHSGNKRGLSAEVLAKRLNIPLEIAKRTLKSTTQLGVRSVDVPTLNRRFHMNDRRLRYMQVACDTFMDTFFATKKAKSIRGYTCTQLFATEFGHVFAVMMDSKKGKNIALAIKRYFKEVGVPLHLICDGAAEQVAGDARILCDEAGCTVVELEAGTPQANRAERYIQMVKNESKTDMFESDSPQVLWCYCVERRCEIIRSVARNNHLLQGQVPETKMTGRICDISHISEFGWYEWCIYLQQEIPFPVQERRLGRVLGPATNKGNIMSQHVLTINGDVLTIQTLRRLTAGELARDSMMEKMKKFDDAIRKRLGDSLSPPSPAKREELPTQDDVIYTPYEDLYSGESEEIEEADSVPADTPAAYDLLLNAEVLLPKDGKHMQTAKVVRRAKDQDGKDIGVYQSNPILNTAVYDVMFPDGSMSQYAANTIAENIYAHVDHEGQRYTLIDYISEHKSDGTAVQPSDAFFVDSKGRRQRRMTTKGHYFKVVWKDGSDSWVPLKELKETHPIEVAEYVTKAEIADLPAFAWWVPYVLKKRNRIIAKVQSRMKKANVMYGVEVPRTVEEAYILDEKNGNTLWREAIAKEMANCRIAFEILDNGENMDPGRIFLECYCVFTCKMDFTRKCRFVANGAKTPDLNGSTYAGVVSRESVRIALTYAALNGLEVAAADIQNAYLQAPISEKYYTICGREFGLENEGKQARIVRALYGTKCAGRDFREHLRRCMEELGYTSCLADPDLWMKEEVDKEGGPYWEYMLLYVDDALCISEDPEGSLRRLDKYFPMKPGSIGAPKLYLGAKLSKVTLENGVEAHAFSMSQYAQEAVKNVEEKLRKEGKTLVKGADSPLSPDYSPEVDISNELEPGEAAYYQSLIGVLRWLVEMGRIDITMEVSAMSSFVAMPREGHMQQLYRMFSYLKSNHNARLVLDPSYPDLDLDAFEKKDWSSYYGNGKELLPPNAPKALGREFIIRAQVDASHAGCKLTRRSRTGFIVLLNNAPVHWYSKKQGSCEISTFGSEFVAMKNCVEYLRGLRYKLRMMGIPVTNPCLVEGDNQSVLWNTTVPDSTLKKKSCAVAYHYVREGVARDEWRTGYVNTKVNGSDILTKTVKCKQERQNKVKMFLRDIFE